MTVGGAPRITRHKSCASTVSSFCGAESMKSKSLSARTVGTAEASHNPHSLPAPRSNPVLRDGFRDRASFGTPLEQGTYDKASGTNPTTGPPKQGGLFSQSGFSRRFATVIRISCESVSSDAARVNGIAPTRARPDGTFPLRCRPSFRCYSHRLLSGLIAFSMSQLTMMAYVEAVHH